MNTAMDDLRVESFPDRPATGPNAMVRLWQSAAGCEAVAIDLHAVQVAMLAERMGLMPTFDPDSKRTIARLSRQIRILARRIEEMDRRATASELDGHYANASEDAAYSEATLELAEEFVADLPAENPPESGAVGGANGPNSGVVTAGNPPIFGAVSKQRDLLEAR